MKVSIVCGDKVLLAFIFCNRYTVFYGYMDPSVDVPVHTCVRVSVCACVRLLLGTLYGTPLLLLLFFTLGLSEKVGLLYIKTHLKMKFVERKGLDTIPGTVSVPVNDGNPRVVQWRRGGQTFRERSVRILDVSESEVVKVFLVLTKHTKKNFPGNKPGTVETFLLSLSLSPPLSFLLFLSNKFTNWYSNGCRSYALRRTDRGYPVRALGSLRCGTRNGERRGKPIQ